MSEWLTHVMDIIKIAVPAVIVYFVVKSLLKHQLDKEIRIKQLELKQTAQNTTLPLQLQAYERLSLFCERISIPNLILRLRTEKMTAAGLHVSLLMAIQHEYEHNITQQVYVSEKLWEIVKFARDESANYVNLAFNNVEGEADSKELAAELFKLLEGKDLAVNVALMAIKKEAALSF